MVTKQIEKKQTGIIAQIGWIWATLIVRTMMLADMGAEVIKIEMPEKGDDNRAFGPFLMTRAGTS